MRPYVALLLLSILLLTACGQQTDERIEIVLVADGSQQTLVLNREATVSEVLAQAGIELGDLDRVNPPTFTRTEDGMIITVVRVAEETVIEQEIIPFGQSTVRNDGLSYGETRLLQAGVNGVAEVTYRITYQDGVEISRNEIRYVVIQEPLDEVVMVGSAGDLPTVTINGTLVYISGGNAWLMSQSSANKRPLTTGGGLDGRVFALSQDGQRLLFTRTTNIDDEAPAVTGTEEAPDEDAESSSPTPTPPPSTQESDEGPESFNKLWAILDLSDPSSEAVELNIENALYAEWARDEDRAIFYSTAEPRPSFPGWQANNDLWRARVSANGVVVRREPLASPTSGGIYGWYGTNFNLAPDGETLAWAQADAVGILAPLDDEQEEDEETRDPADLYGRASLLDFAPATLYEDVVWRPTLSWSPDGAFIATTTHGTPLGDETSEDSPVYDLTLLSADGTIAVDIIPQAGMWSMPQFSPTRVSESGNLVGLVAFLKAIEPLNSVAGRYRLAVADRDGSNQRPLFPAEEEPGLLPQIVAWSPDARQVAAIHQGDLFIVDVSSGRTQQLSSDGLSSNPRWAP